MGCRGSAVADGVTVHKDTGLQSVPMFVGCCGEWKRRTLLTMIMLTSMRGQTRTGGVAKTQSAVVRKRATGHCSKILEVPSVLPSVGHVGVGGLDGTLRRP